MKPLKTYIKEVLGLHLELQPPDRALTNKLPMYLKEGYQWQQGLLADRPCLFAERSEKNDLGIAQMDKHFQLVRQAVGLPVIAVFPELEAYNRKRLIERQIAFVVPGKQLYIPEFFIDLKEYGGIAKKEHTRLTPMGQLLLLFHILDKTQSRAIENKTFKELAPMLGTNPMGITRAVENLKQHELIEVTGDKEKYIRFTTDKQGLWRLAEEKDILINPVLKKVYADEKPKGTPMYYCNMSALAEYTDMNPGSQDFYAIEKSVFYELQKNKVLTNINELEGNYCLEVWKYSPEKLAEVLPNKMHVVDPISLYLSLKGSNDERIEMALEQLTKSALW
jgi:DNA-binding transcriptional regulator YhcF (GntR family)